MALVKQKIKGTFMYPDGSPMVGAILKLTLLKSDVDAQTGVSINKVTTQVVLDDKGFFTTEVWPTQRGTTELNFYKVTLEFPNQDGSKRWVKEKKGQISVPDNGGTLDISLLYVDGKTTNNFIQNLKDTNESLESRVKSLEVVVEKLTKSVNEVDYSKGIKELKLSLEQLPKVEPQVDYSKDIEALRSLIEDTTKEPLKGPFLNDKGAADNEVALKEPYLRVGGMVSWRVK